MTLSSKDIQKLAQLAKLNVSDDNNSKILESMNTILGLVNKLESVETDGVEPLYHPLSLIQSVALPLHEDVPLSASNPQQRSALMQNAPLANDGLFLVPNVIE